ncbi:Asp23/Gls24 family envelope stress response protein [Streptomyces sp. NBC_00820]|uniref:Asp23/Gls24 family envelope stress response protein n=1 Tax=Streptomyces sp. NBC_00820 TaxID=2975842 RepID=UPI002ED570D7|nr:Asp23/Gls24 family envelope stress response protein [Streptomyces sp. NBC_00820]
MSLRPASVTSVGGGHGSSARGSGPPPPAERGATVIRDKAVARIAARAARVAQSRRAALPPDPGGSSAPSAFAAVRTGTVRVRLDLDLPYPTDLPVVCERIQHDVAERVAQLTGLRVGEVTLTVRRLVPSADARRGRVR